MNDDRDGFDLSPEGASRRESMRAALVERAAREFVRRRRRRRARVGGALAIVLGGGAWLAAMLVAPSPRPAAPPGGGPVAGGGDAPAPIVEDRGGRVVVVRDQTRIDPASVAISDDELLALLASIGRRTGLARIEGRVVLTADVTDEGVADDSAS